MRRTRIIKGLIIAIILVVAAVLIYKNYVAAEGDFGVSASSSVSDYSSDVAVNVTFSENVQMFSGTVTYDSGFFDYKDDANITQANDAGGTITIMDMSVRDNFYMGFRVKDGVSGTGYITLQFSQVTTGEGVPYTNLSTTVSVTVDNPVPPPSAGSITPNPIYVGPGSSSVDVSCDHDVSFWTSNNDSISVQSTGSTTAVVTYSGQYISSGATIEALDENHRSIATATVNIAEPSEEYPVITPASLTLTPSNNTATLECSMDVKEWISGNGELVSIEPQGDRGAIITLLGESGGPITVTAITKDNKRATALVGIAQDGYTPLPDDPTDPEPINPDDYPEIPVQAGCPVISPSGNQSLIVGNSLQMKSDQANVTWQSSDVGVAMVSGSGMIQAISKGSAMITVKNQNGDSTSFFVIVNNPGANNGGSTSDNTNNTTTKSNTLNNTTTKTGKENPTADDSVPETGENTMEMVVLMAIITLIVAAVIFKKKSRKSR